MTVSLALRNLAGVSRKQRAKIRATAKKLNYSPDPALAALAAYRRTHYPRPDPTPIAWISNFPTRDQWNQPGHFVQKYFLGASRRAKEIGYHLEHFWLGEPRMTHQRLSKILYTRGITGILLPPQYSSFTHLNLDWDKFCPVTFGYSLTRPRLHMTTCNHYRSMGMVVRKLRSLGYRRIGLTLYAFHDTRVSHAQYASFLMEMLAIPSKYHIPVYLEPEWKPGIDTNAEKLKWFRAHRPEVVISSVGNSIDAVLREEGLRCPEDVGLVSLGTREDSLPDAQGRIFSGSDENVEETGVAAVDLVVTLMHRNERGIPATARTVLIDSKWVQGTTTRRVNRDAVASGA